MWPIILAGFSLGLISSLHCVGMCGPLMLALPVRHLDRNRQGFALLLYNVGRVITYSVIGLLIGFAGRRIYLAGLQQWLSIAMGVMVLVMALIYFFWKRSLQPSWMMRLHIRLQQAMSKLLYSAKMRNYLLLGMANGLLPCGMVYMAIAGALLSTGIIHSTVFMMMFGMGTLPAMMALGFFGVRITAAARQHMRRAMPYLVTAMAIVLILRGMNLGIPFISPEVNDLPSGRMSCH